MLTVAVQPADVQDRDGALPLLKEARRRFPFVDSIFADGAYQGESTAVAVRNIGAWQRVIVKRPEIHKFIVVPKRWIVERTIAWLNRCRRLAKDFENRIRTAIAFVQLASIRLMLRKLCNPS